MPCHTYHVRIRITCVPKVETTRRLPPPGSRLSYIKTATKNHKDILLLKSRASFVLFSFEQSVLKDITQGQHAREVLVLVDDDESVYARPAYRVVDCGELILHRAGVDTWEILRDGSARCCLRVRGTHTSDRFKRASPTLISRSS